MSCGFPCTKRNRNRVVPIEDLLSERIEVSPQRFIRVLHSSPQSTRNSEDRSSSANSSKVSCDRSFEHQDNQNIIVIFFIHGVGGCAELWYEQLRHFCRAGYAVVAPDLLGHGCSSAPRDRQKYEFGELSNDMMAVFDRFSRKRNILVGHSYGSSFCSLIASSRLRRVSKVVLISGGGPIPLQPESCHLFCLPTFVLSIIKPCLLWSFERRAFYRHHHSVSKYKLRAFSAPMHVIKATLQGQNWEVGDETFHKELMVPSLLLYGAHDIFVTIQEEQWMNEVIYNSSLEVIQDAGHMVMVEKPDKVNWFIHNFLQRDPTTRSSNILSPLRGMSKDSIHVKVKNPFTPRKLSLAVESQAEFPMDDLDFKSQSISELRKCSIVSLTVPSSTGFEPNSLPGSLTSLEEHISDKKDVKL